MYISIKLPPAFGSFNQLRKENYPFNNLFTSYLAAVSQLGLNLGMDVEELVGYIEDRIFDGQRLPDVPEGAEPVNIRYKINIPENAEESHPGIVVQRYIEGSSLTNRMAVMYIARMTLRLSAAYGTSLFRLTRLITDLQNENVGVRGTVKREQKKPEQKQISSFVQEEPAPMPKMRIRPSATPVEQSPVLQQAPASSSAERARAAVNALAGLAAQVEPDDGSTDASEAAPDVVKTNPALSDFL